MPSIQAPGARTAFRGGHSLNASPGVHWLQCRIRRVTRMWFCLFGECRLFWGRIRCLLCAPSDFLGLASLQNPWLLFRYQLLLLWWLLPGPGAATVASLSRTQCLSLGFLKCLSPVCSPVAAEVWEARTRWEPACTLFYSAGWSVGLFCLVGQICDQWGNGARGCVFISP